MIDRYREKTFDWRIQKGLSPNITFELKLEGDNELAIQRNEREPFRESKEPVCKGPRLGKRLVYLRNKKEDQVARVW